MVYTLRWLINNSQLAKTKLKAFFELSDGLYDLAGFLRFKQRY
ncbi:hypothetical protein M917_0444 [Psychrobacter aquaticus CMS 56]|uniref:Uncharacterized protein n=1 Tax=Psychrobacter aquaticus CMS 56 TaxID=1354303 RepID=U4TDK2_9GAMM|nr:hypothetical protein M917_0444 [Psychrobacter aquaticus CMS 56]